MIHVIFNNGVFTKDSLQCSNDPSNRNNDRLGGVIAVCVVLSILVFLVLIGTLMDLIVIQTNQNQALTEKSSCAAWIAEFSAYRTLCRIFTTQKKKNDNSFAFINGIRVLALFWIIFGHSFAFGMMYAVNNLDVLSWLENPAFQLITGGVLSVDTFFVVSGFLTAIIFVRQASKKTLSFRFVLLYYIHRYIRLTPTFILVMFVSIYLTPYFGRGPIYPTEQGFETEECRKHYWWTAFLYIGNLINPASMCLPVSWYLFNDMQFHWIAPLSLIPFALGRKKIAYSISTAYIFIGIATVLGLLLRHPNFSPNMVQNALELFTDTVSSKSMTY